MSATKITNNLEVVWKKRENELILSPTFHVVFCASGSPTPCQKSPQSLGLASTTKLVWFASWKTRFGPVVEDAFSRHTTNIWGSVRTLTRPLGEATHTDGSTSKCGIKALRERTRECNRLIYRMWTGLQAGQIIRTAPKISVTLIAWLRDRTELFTKYEPRFGTRTWCFNLIHCQHESWIWKNPTILEAAFPSLGE